jgi:hypothetical protein
MKTISAFKIMIKIGFEAQNDSLESYQHYAKPVDKSVQNFLDGEC